MPWNYSVETFTRPRFTPGVYTDGEAGAPTSADSDIDATRDPVPDDEVDTLPEGERQRGQMWLISKDELRCASDHTTPVTLADHVSIDGEWYEVRSVVNYSANVTGLPHYEARVRKIKVP